MATIPTQRVSFSNTPCSLTPGAFPVHGHSLARPSCLSRAGPHFQSQSQHPSRLAPHSLNCSRHHCNYPDRFLSGPTDLPSIHSSLPVCLLYQPVSSVRTRGDVLHSVLCALSRVWPSVNVRRIILFFLRDLESKQHHNLKGTAKHSLGQMSRRPQSRAHKTSIGLKTSPFSMAMPVTDITNQSGLSFPPSLSRTSEPLPTPL